LKYPCVRFNEAQRSAIAAGIKQACEESQISLHACAVGFDHVHIVTSRHRKSIELIVGQFKGRAAQQMRAADCYSFERFTIPNALPPTPWAKGCWSVFINDAGHLRSAIEYVRRHPMKEGLPAQDWDFLTPLS
jgi:REP element-mobilizing transposase RayT